MATKFLISAVAGAALTALAPWLIATNRIANVIHDFTPYDARITSLLTTCTAQHPLQLLGCEDMRLVSGSIYTACLGTPGLENRHKFNPESSRAPRPWSGDKLFLWDLDADSLVELELRGFPGTGAENRSFHGIDVNELPDGSVSIYVINHLREESVVDKFVHSPGTGFVMHVLRVPTAPQVPHPNSVFALPERDGESAFYVTNDHFYERGWLRYFEALTRRRWGWVSYYSSRTGWRRAVSGLAGANGIVGDKTPGGKRRVYVSETFDGAVRVLEEEAEGGLREVQKVKVDMLADNLALAEGGLYVAGPARGLGFWPWIEKPEENKGPGMVVKRFGTGQLGEGFYGEGYTVAPAVEVLVMDDGRLQNASTSVVFRPYKVEEVVEKEERQGWEDEEEEEEEPVVEATGPAPVKGDLYITGLQFRGILKCVDFE